jgi:hypothetical protein
MATRKPQDPAEKREKAKRAALKALQRVRRETERTGTELSDWEGEFLGSVEKRVETYGRAFADPAKGDTDASLSMLQTVKLKEIRAKTKAKNKGDDAERAPQRRGLARRKPMRERNRKPRDE